MGDKEPGRRVYSLYHDYLMLLFKEWQEGHVVGIEGLPGDARAVSIGQEFGSGDVLFLVESASFGPTPAGVMMPRMSGRALLGPAEYMGPGSYRQRLEKIVFEPA